MAKTIHALIKKHRNSSIFLGVGAGQLYGTELLFVYLFVCLLFSCLLVLILSFVMGSLLKHSSDYCLMI